MRTRKSKSIIIATILILVTILVFVPTVSAAGENIMGVYPASSQVTIGDKFYTPINVTINWEADTATILNMTYQPSGIINFSNSTEGDLFPSPLLYYHPQDGETWSVVNNDSGYCYQFNMVDNDEQNNTNKSLTIITWDAVDVGIVYINLTHITTIRDTVDYGTLSENTTIYVYPDYPSSFSTSSGISWDNLTWTRGSGEDNAMIRYSTSTYPTTISEGTLLYNGSLEYNNFSKDIEKDYYYSIWGWNGTFGWHSLSYDTETTSSLANLPSGFTATTDNRTAISLNWTELDTVSTVLYPNSIGSSTDFTDEPGAGENYEKVDDAVGANDEDTTMVYGTGWDSYGVGNSDITNPIKNITVQARMYRAGIGGDGRITIYNGATIVNGSIEDLTAGYINYTATWETNPWTSLAWTWSNINSLEIGVIGLNAGAACTQEFLTVNYYDTKDVVIERNTIEGWQRTSGVEIYNDSNLSFTDTSLLPDTTYYYQLWTYDGDTNFSSANVTANAQTDANIGTSLAGETPSDDASGIDKDYATVNVTISDYEGDLFNWTIEGLYITNSGANGASNGSKSANLITSLPYSTNIIWYVNSTDMYNWTNATYNFTTRDQHTPSVPSGFSATTYNRTRINLAWTLTDDKSYLEWNSFAGWARGAGTTLDNGSNESFSHTGLTEGTHYYYQIWSYNTTDSVFSSSNATATDTTDANQAPTQHGETPTDDSGQQSLTLATVNVTLYDPEGDTMSWWFQTSTGNSNNGAGATNGTSISCSLTNPHDYEEEVVWFVNVTDGTDWTNSTYNFTARSQYKPTVPTGFSSTTYNRTRIDLAWTNADDKTYIEWDLSSSWAIGAGTEIYNSSSTTYQHISLDDGVRYYYQAWSYNITDNVYSSSYSSDNDITTANQLVVQSSESPTDDSGNVDKTQTPVQVTINDPEGDTMSWTIFVSTGNSDSGSQGNGSISCTLTTPLSYDTNIIWYVNVTDGFNSTNEVYNFTVRSEYIPDTPTAFTATNISSTQINLEWTNNPGNVTYIEYNTTSGWPRFSGTFLENSSSNTTYQHSGLTKDTTYYYQAWSYNVTDNTYSVSNVTVNNKTQANTVPNQLGANDVYPVNASEWIEPGYFSANVTDDDADNMDVSFYWQNGTLIGTDSNVVNGTTAQVNIPFTLVNYTWYTWYVNVTDGDETYHSQDWVFRQEAYDYDIDRDSKCFPSDLSGVAAHYMESGDPHWIRADVNRGGSVGPEDLSGIAAHYMEEY